MAPTHQFCAENLIKSGRISEENFSQLKQWCSTQNLSTLSNEQLVLFLLSTYDNLKEAKNTIHSYFRCRIQAPQILANRNMDAEDIQQVVKVCDYTVLPARTATNDALIVMRLQDTSYKNFIAAHVLKMLVMVAELPFYQDPPDGLLVIVDLAGFGFLHLTTLKIHPVRYFFQYLQEGFPGKLKQIHVLNSASVLDKLRMIVKPLMSDKLYRMVLFHPASLDMETFFEKHVPKNCLPKDFGGTLPEIDVLKEATYSEIGKLTQFYREEEEQVKESQEK